MANLIDGPTADARIIVHQAWISSS